jgi:hydroxypyruvate reductase
VTVAAARNAPALERGLRAALEHALASAVTQVFTRTAEAARRHASEGEAWTVIAVGKAAVPMYQGAIKGLGQAGASVREALVVAPDLAVLLPSSMSVKCMHASHPLPDRRSVRAAEHALTLCHRAGRSGAGRLLVLVSGGTSALLAKPATGVTLAQKKKLVDGLLRAGATIQEINLVRRHLSAVKGGGLLRASGRAPLVTLIVSDVLGDAPWDIGSGPSSPDPTTRKEAYAVLHQRLPSAPKVTLRETLKPRVRRPGGATTTTEVVASPSWFAMEVAGLLRKEGLRTRVLSPSNDDVQAMADEYVQCARNMAPGSALVRPAEPSLRVADMHGRGGRSSHLAALLAARLPPGVVFLAGATDGADGSSGAAGAAVHRGSFRSLGESAVLRALAAFDTGPLHSRAGTLIRALRPSGVNFADVHVLARVTSS